jgi:hypothetical protein
VHCHGCCSVRHDSAKGLQSGHGSTAHGDVTLALDLPRPLGWSFRFAFASVAFAARYGTLVWQMKRVA